MGNKSVKPKGGAAAEAQRLVEDAITTHPVVIFSKTYCPYCHSAKSDISRAGAAVAGFTPPKIYELDTMGSRGRAIQSYLAKKTGRRTVPNVFIGGVTVGGGDEVSSYARRNILKQMLTQAPDRLAASKPAPAAPVAPAPAPIADTAEGLVEGALKDYPVVVFSKSWCPYCKAAKAHLADAAPSVPGYTGANLFELDQMGARGDEIENYLAERTGRYTVPNVFVAGTSVGGGDEVAALAAKGELLPLISAAVQRGSAEPAPPSVPASAGPSEDPARKLVDDAVAANPVVVFSKSWCPYCISAKANLAKVGAGVPGYQPAKVFELDDMGGLGEDVQRYLGEKTGQRTVPNVFIAGKPVGGGNDVAGYVARGELKEMLAEATAAAPKSEPAPATGPVLKEIVFGAGCFWGVELAFQRVHGVVKTEVGYSNGRLSRVSYEAVCTGRTGSAEVVRVTYDPAVVSLSALLAVWEGRHDPTSMNKQGNDIGTQYRSAVFYNDNEQKTEIEKWSAEAATRLPKPIVSDIAPVKNYCPAEDYHQQYLEKKGQNAEKGSNSYIRCYG